MSHSSDDAQLLATPFERGGRRIGHGIDCAGVVLHKLAQLGLPAFDPWAAIADRWAAGQLHELDGLFPPGWSRCADGEQLRDGDLLLFGANRMGVALVQDGVAWTARPHCGVLRLPLDRLGYVAEVWRYDDAKR